MIRLYISSNPYLPSRFIEEARQSRRENDLPDRPEVKRKMKKKISIIFLILILTFIWGHSLMSREASQEESLLVGGFLTPILELFVGKGNVTDHLVRKLAHFCEFGALGFALAMVASAYEKVDFFHLSYAFLCGMAAAVVDEGIQLFVEGRGSQVSDVLLDSSGVLAGLLFGVGIHYLIEKRNK